jgi:hypothetical protein
MLSPVTLKGLAGSGLGAGPASTAPSVIEYSLPWHGQSIRPSAIWLTMQPMWVQTALKTLNSPAVGWVTTVVWAAKILPPPTGMALVAVSAPAAEPPEAAEGDEAEAGVDAAALVAAAAPSCSNRPNYRQ